MLKGAPFEKHPGVGLVLHILLASSIGQHEEVLGINCDMHEQQQQDLDLTC
jgi:hypothetical protein